MGGLSQIVRYGLVGLANTGLGFMVIAVLTYSGAPPFVANALGFAAGLVISFALNRTFTFRSTRQRSAIAPFLLAFAICYGLNLVALHIAGPLAAFNALLPQVCGILVYNLAFFLFMKFVIFPIGTGKS